MSISSNRRRLATFLAVAAVLLGADVAAAAEEAVVIPPPAIDEAAGSGTQTAIFAGGCFWGVQGVFQHVKGVESAVSGYAGGTAKTAQYEIVSTGSTGHAEAVEVKFDPKQVSYGRLLQIFFSVAHNPTQLNFQGPDRGTQYRSALFVLDPQQRKVAERYIDQLDKAHVFPRPIVTKVSETTGFYPAEAYHQDFLTLNPTYPYIVYNDLPKIENLKSLFPADYRSQPVLVGKTRG
ncbi:peptide-methionine (S)-S-oxide reductase [Rhizobium sophoriradicis]|uniref:peptide-methionine (S)-S-oxide reductase MsrA n=1 Tax=Rhizobium sophoriradicis TaxID=1535245 RepID=UPI000BBDD0BD|nr:peptide-methionine (S)-S-oxide reductase MsrA [Rhizobium sophoriradicis]PCK87437.1 peptide-methionine (S)-S-oxide reductase [Rhizobium sophoriradicis]